jgi:hypothetical protein
LQLRKGFRLATGRLPDAEELAILKDSYADELNRFAAEKADAIAFLSIGYKERDNSLDPIRTAALAIVINSVMNTAESYTRI